MLKSERSLSIPEPRPVGRVVRAIQDVTSRRSRLRRSANPADSFRLRASSSILRNRPTRSASYRGRPMPCSAFSSSNSIWRMVLSVSRFTRTVGVPRPEVGSRCARLLMTGNARNRPQAVRQPDYARTAWATRSYQSMDKKSSECNSTRCSTRFCSANQSQSRSRQRYE